MTQNQNLLILGSVWPEPQSSAAGVRMMQLIKFFLSQGLKVTFASAAAHSPYCADLSELQVEKVTVALNTSDFDLYIRQLNPSIVVFDRFIVEEQFGWRVAEQCPDALRILDTEDLHCLRRARHNAFKESKEFSANDLLTSDVARREIASILRCDISLIISSYELKILKEVFKVDESLLYYLPFLTDRLNEEQISQKLSFTDRQNFISIGNFLHEPNCDSVKFLKEAIWPLVRISLPDAELHIYGAYPVQKVTQLHNAREGFLIKGRADNAMKVMEAARVCLAPLRFGAGLKGKLLDAMICGTPSVTTNIGAESMHEALPWSGAIADDPHKIAGEAIQLYTDEDLWLTAQSRGVQIINSCFLEDDFTQKLSLKLSKLQNALADHRRNNFTGSMLMHHTMASTKFMSRWIEAKNSKVINFSGDIE